MKTKGFTLIELMIAVAIAAILAAIAYPSYLEQVRKSRRSDAIAALLKTAQVLERCYTEYNAYNDTSCPAVDDSDNTKLATAYTGTDEGYYTLSATTLTATAFTLQAAPQNDQANDKCGKLTFDHIGQKGIQDAASGVTVADCW
ncbi:type IV pilus assembly protein PilE [Methylomarinovum tepidoasis]|uniref:Type IV pilus assembly protein PilE n=1 Tax=Methylomarinovum tepidoasis TaxID=2840183 RepID=A0AAU9CLL7_9GAMM|nr:type IV pilin protein [Methylomarinovum sp. IN45]BCX88537.1 type IV pilus assembly protein PilE [Methylomarinovum sp. IN45]